VLVAAMEIATLSVAWAASLANACARVMPVSQRASSMGVRGSEGQVPMRGVLSMISASTFSAKRASSALIPLPAYAARVARAAATAGLTYSSRKLHRTELSAAGRKARRARGGQSSARCA
jgi:hypothetical protein